MLLGAVVRCERRSGMWRNETRCSCFKEKILLSFSKPFYQDPCDGWLNDELVALAGGVFWRIAEIPVLYL